MTAQWEYNVLTFEPGWKGFDYDRIERDLNDLGREGWEALTTMAPSIGSGHVLKVAVVLKRARTEQTGSSRADL